ncbi:PFL_4703 family integrating conjugative element protein [Aggregatibacter actinomycetemcomitans]|jgi:integrating conjugative element protein, PFL_4703 family|uniref:PFL_4703 family integrating conjugative element protein n=1 Tax=Aggregatibacter actinomycetemcomitans TaxID=714 RepID=UPI00077E5D52|nr:TIGR03746 family integrating conjugative element protein [Aggregatibacter actinomycetemcomitans]KYK82820.1 integrating conjugative element protein [Aggregatibacter actinomycetemcomitans serotype e str. SC936]QEH46002.1 TIGR03746 family integrating conjugative element protein [Aggregatibacter actinomycetemcomitans]TYA23469.1 TIGR03746 family integrating conjugative element protein [Aggregatibacter actinomycetemcomitans]TYA28612.1 TIGR03746 family integrating conjugative element protein [Aggre
MSKLKGAINQAKKDILTARMAIGALFIICLVLCGVIYSLPRFFTVHIPPDMRAGSQRSMWEVPPSTVYAFAYQTFQQLNRWVKNGEENYKENIEDLRALTTPGCQQFLEKDYYDRLSNGELKERTRGVYEIVGRGFSNDRVIVHSPDSWTVNLDLNVDEFFKDEKVKNTLTRFPISIVKMDTDISKNPWGLGFNCYSSIPLRLEAIESKESK